MGSTRMLKLVFTIKAHSLENIVLIATTPGSVLNVASGRYRSLVPN
jgi:hypothetical protein